MNSQTVEYINARLKGLNKTQAAIAAGFPKKSAGQAGYRLEKQPEVKAAIGRGVAMPSGTTDPLEGKTFEDPEEFIKAQMNCSNLTMEQRTAAALNLHKIRKGGKTEPEKPLGKKEEAANNAKSAHKTGPFRPRVVVVNG